MAAAEARAAWQRANRCFVQEDAKRAPKLACSSAKQVGAGPANAADRPEHPTVGFMPFNRTHSYSNLPPDSKWWLQMQPNYMDQRGLNTEQFNVRKGDVQLSPPVTMDRDSQVEIATMSEESIRTVNFEDLESFLDVKKHPELGVEELSVLDSKVDQDFLDVKNMTDYYEYLEMEMVGGSVSKQTSEFSSNADSSWLGGEKVPWWRVADGEELASFVAQKSFHHIENCDLPPPQKLNLRRKSCKQASSVNQDEIFMSSPEWEAQSDAISSPSSGGSQKKHRSPVEGQSQNENVATEPLRTKNNDEAAYGKAKLLEALCHSQTRAREAEKAAKQAYMEKEHIIKLFFRQASQLFVYKQWFKMLQLESLLHRDDDSSPLSVFPDLLPWVPKKPQKLHKTQKTKARRGKRCSTEIENGIGKYVVAFAVGFTLIGAGLFIGWSVGWLLPPL